MKKESADKFNWGKWGAIAGIAALVVSAFTMLSSHYRSAGELEESLSGIHSDIQRIDARLDRQDGRIDHQDEVIGEILLKRLSENAKDPQAAKEAQKLVVGIKQANEKLSVATVEEATTKFVEASVKQPEAWDTALQLLAYRTSLNDQSGHPEFKELSDNGAYVFLFKHGTAAPTFYTYGNVPPDKAARLLPLNPEQFGLTTAVMEKLSEGTKEVLEIRGGDIALDGLFFKNIIVRDAQVTYGGGPVSLQNVSFINCTFRFPPSSAGRQIVEAISHTPTSLKIG